MQSARRSNSAHNYSVCWELFEKGIMQMENEKETCREIVQILKEQFGIPEGMLGEENWETRLTSNAIGMPALDLVYLFFEVEKRLGVRISSESLENHGWDSVHGIVKAVCYAKDKR